STDPLAQLPTDYTFTSADQGTHTFNVTFGTIGPFGTPVAKQLVVSDGVFSDSDTYKAQLPPDGVGLDNASVLQPPGPVAKLVLRAPESTMAGSAFLLSVTAEDANGDVVPYYDSVSFSSSDASASLPATYQFQSLDAGTHTFSGNVLNTIGAQT